MKFSLILATLERTGEPAALLNSLAAQTYGNFEVIIVDQNTDDRLLPMIKHFSDKLLIRHYHSKPGLSRARNIGIKQAIGDIFAFPDDDCKYPPHLLERIAEYFRKEKETDGLTGRGQDPECRTPTSVWSGNAGLVRRLDIWQKGISFTIFLRKTVIEQVGGFDETLGIGAGTPWGSGEETDYLLRAIEKRSKIFYDPGLIVYHPEPIPVYTEKAIERACKYGKGMGKVCRKHHFPFWFMAYILIRSLFAAFFSLLRLKLLKTRFHFALFRSRLIGWLD